MVLPQRIKPLGPAHKVMPRRCHGTVGGMARDLRPWAAGRIRTSYAARVFDGWRNDGRKPAYAQRKRAQEGGRTTPRAGSAVLDLRGLRSPGDHRLHPAGSTPDELRVRRASARELRRFADGPRQPRGRAPSLQRVARQPLGRLGARAGGSRPRLEPFSRRVEQGLVWKPENRNLKDRFMHSGRGACPPLGPAALPAA